MLPTQFRVSSVADIFSILTSGVLKRAISTKRNRGGILANATPVETIPISIGLGLRLVFLPLVSLLAVWRVSRAGDGRIGETGCGQLGDRVLGLELRGINLQSRGPRGGIRFNLGYPR